jgi:pentatricopeptide repeat protein
MLHVVFTLRAGQQWECAVKLFEQMQQRGCMLTYTALINACAKGCQWYRALQVGS